MVWSTLQRRGNAAIWALVRRQHGVITYRQLRELGVSRRGIEHRIRIGRLHCLHRGVYSVGRREVTQNGHWMAAVLACGEGAALSHESAAALWGIRRVHAGAIQVSVPWPRNPRHDGIYIHRRRQLTPDLVTARDVIPVTAITLTLIDLATHLGRDSLEAAINEADNLGLTTPNRLREDLLAHPAIHGTARLRRTLDRRTFTLTDSHLERRFLRLARQAGLPKPRTQEMLQGHRVDFHWPEFDLVVETDGLRYHRTPAQQAKDRHRDQALTAAGLTVLRFTHGQIRHDPDEVAATLTATSRRAA
jgi:very-short-patch-repair endonuclease